jgi:hypothetical protein
MFVDIVKSHRGRAQAWEQSPEHDDSIEFALYAVESYGLGFGKRRWASERRLDRVEAAKGQKHSAVR